MTISTRGSALLDTLRTDEARWRDRQITRVARAVVEGHLDFVAGFAFLKVLYLEQEGISLAPLPEPACV